MPSPELLEQPSHPRRICFWIKGAVVWRLGAVKLVVLPFDVSFPGGGGSYSSVASGPCLREVQASPVSPSSVLSPGDEGSLSLASPALGVSSDELSTGSMKLSEVKTKRGSEEIWFRWRLSGNLSSRFAVVAPATSRGGDGQVEAEATRVVLMVFYAYTCPASLTRGSTEVVQFLLFWAADPLTYLICPVGFWTS
ncbi:hypothetical protein DY000_02035552 [Brassica cretica]|uniref:Uncharacterized protein n=1 Tax=Brassica cretica TaxID=69181 RepID=A0ABQ7DI71_BRACR|nr:hypothetical protein DY000_02035552 [Brassica cretica]